MRIIRYGSARWVILTKRFAFKFPSLSSWRQFLLGLLANIRESEWHSHDDRFCPIKLSISGGVLVVMPRCEPLTEAEFATFDYDEFVSDKGREFSIVNLVENKDDSFGRLGNKIVAVDYGN